MDTKKQCEGNDECRAKMKESGLIKTLQRHWCMQCTFWCMCASILFMCVCVCVCLQSTEHF